MISCHFRSLTQYLDVSNHDRNLDINNYEACVQFHLLNIKQRSVAADSDAYYVDRSILYQLYCKHQSKPDIFRPNAFTDRHFLYKFTLADFGERFVVISHRLFIHFHIFYDCQVGLQKLYI